MSCALNLISTQARLRCSYAEVIATKFYCRHHELVDRYEISQMTMNVLLYLSRFVSFFYHRQDLTRLDYEINRGCLIRSRNCLPLESTRVHPRFFGGISVADISFLYRVVCVFCFCCSSFHVLFAQCCLCLWIVHSWLSIRFSLTFIYSCWLDMTGARIHDVPHSRQSP